MVTHVLFIVFVIFQVCYADSNSKAPFITKCTQTDTTCMTKSAREALPIFVAGIPGLGVETLDPMIFDLIDSSTPELKLILRNATFSGLKNCIINRVERNLEESKMHLSTECTFNLDGNYELSQILLLPIQGAGHAHFRLNKMALEFSSDMTERTGTDGQKYLSLNNLKYTFMLKEDPDIEIDNLFNSDQNLARAAEELFQTSAKDIIMEIGRPVFDPIVARVYESIQSFFNEVPMKDLVIV